MIILNQLYGKEQNNGREKAQNTIDAIELILDDKFTAHDIEGIISAMTILAEREYGRG